MIGRFKIKGEGFKFFDDMPVFKETEHPRAKNGEFTSGGGASGKQIANKTTAPKAGTTSHKIWSLAAQIEEGGGKPTAAAITALAAKENMQLNSATVGTQLHHYKKFKSGEGNKMPAEPKPESIKNAVANFHSTMEKSSAYKKEGTFNGIEYYKSADGKDKISYSPESGSWRAISNGAVTNKGEDLESLQKFLNAKPNVAKTVNEPKPTPKPAPELEPVKKSDEGSLSSAKRYASTISNEHFDFSPRGISTELGFSENIKKSIKAYRGSTYYEINKAMRFSEHGGEVSHKILMHIFNLQRAFQIAPPTTKDAVVGRKVKMNALQTMCKSAGLNHLSELMPGMVLQEEGVCSTSIKNAWYGDVKFEIFVPKGSKAIDLAGTMNKSEGEVLLPPLSKLKITEVKQDHDTFKYHIKCELVK